MPSGIDACILKVQTFPITHLTHLRPEHEKSFQTIIYLVKETHGDRAHLSQATASRRKRAQDVLKAVFQEAVGLFLLCALSLPITALASIKKPDEVFFERLRTIPIPVAFSQLAQNLVNENRNIFIISGFLPAETESQLAQSAKRNPELDRTNPKRRRIDGQRTGHRGISTVSGDFEDSSDDHDDGRDEEGSVKASDDEDNDQNKLDGNDDTEEANVNQPSALLNGTAYKVTAIDVVRIMLDDRIPQEVEYVFTMPAHEGVKPFITIHCPDRFAMRFLTSRAPIPW